MSGLFQTCISVIATVLLAYSQCALRDKLSYYEVFTMSENFHTRARRSIGPDHQPRVGHEITLKIFNKTLLCHLYPRKDLFTTSFRLVVIDDDKKTVVNDFDKDQFLNGNCEDDETSVVHGYFSEGVFEGTITYNGIVYGIEKAKRHLEESKHREHAGKMIAYRSTDVIWEQNSRGPGPSFCGARHVDDVQDSSQHGMKQQTFQDSSSRVKRIAQPYTWSTCRVIAVADFKFYQYIGGHDIYNTASYIGSIIESVDSIYRGTEFNIGADVTGLGFELAEIQIHVKPTSGYNANQSSWEPLKLLQMFGRDLYFKDFCVAHLFTHQRFDGNVLGLAYIAAESTSSAGGLCSPTRNIDGHTTALNTGWSTTMNSNDDVVLTQQAQLVTAHELGHNWGAEHDPDTDSCSPSSMFDSGKYLMYAYSVSGSDNNNYKFSTCSRRDISAVLISKSQGCFSETPDEDRKCGNGLIDPEEECDAGLLGRFGLDPCCSSQCHLLGTATCSPVNHECCENCQIAPFGTQCLGDIEISCHKASYCNGLNLSCPTPANKAAESPCLDMGLCDGSGVCEPFCEARRKVSCTCDTLNESCQRCCRDSANSSCKPYDSDRFPLPNSRPCVLGYCLNGVCLKSEVSLVQRLFHVFDSLSIDGILQFFRNNLVGCVMVFSLIIWVPISCCISYQFRDYVVHGRYVGQSNVRQYNVSKLEKKDHKFKRGINRQVSADIHEVGDYLYNMKMDKVVVHPQILSAATAACTPHHTTEHHIFRYLWCHHIIRSWFTKKELHHAECSFDPDLQVVLINGQTPVRCYSPEVRRVI